MTDYPAELSRAIARLKAESLARESKPSLKCRVCTMLRIGRKTCGALLLVALGAYLAGTGMDTIDGTLSFARGVVQFAIR